jgi:DNA invertase Pin-like site-specific DNA recombinase
MQKEATIEDQERQCRKVANERNWIIPAGQTYADQARSGTSLFKRNGLGKLMVDAEKKPRPFDIVLFFETSRLARNLEDMLRLTRKLSEFGIRVYFVGQGLDSTDPNFRTTLTVWGMVDELQIASLRRNIWKGQEGQVLKGFSSGSRCFGYGSVRVSGGTTWEVIESDARTINRIYEMYADGVSVHRIVRKLTEERVPAARKPKIGDVDSSWNHNLVQRILRNQRYIGVYVWNRTHQHTDHDTGRVIVDRKKSDQHKRVENPALRIVSDELWAKVQARHKVVDERVTGYRLGGINRAQNKSYLFSAMGECAVCGESMVITGGKGSEACYGCKAARYMRGCTNKLRIRQDRFATQMLRALADNLLASDQLDYLVEHVCKELNDQLQRDHRSAQTESPEDLARQKAAVASRIDTLMDHIEVTPVSESEELKARLTERRAERDALDAKIAARRRQSPPKISVEETRRLVVAKVNNLMEVCQNDVDKARQVLQQFVHKLIFIPVETPDGPAYEIVGDIDLFAPGVAPEGDVMLGDLSTQMFQHYESFRHGFLIRIDPRLVEDGEKGPTNANALCGLLVDLLKREPSLNVESLRAEEWAAQFTATTGYKEHFLEPKNMHYILRTHPEAFLGKVGITSKLDNSGVRRYSFRLATVAPGQSIQIAPSTARVEESACLAA